MTHTLTDYIRSQCVLLATLLLLIANPSWAGSDTNASPPTLLVLGDSLSAGYGLSDLESGWVNLLQTALEQDYRVVNASISGETSAGGLTRLPALLQAHSPAILIVELGGNDGLRGYSLSQLRKQLSDIINLAKAQSVDVLLMEMQIPPNYGRRYTEKFTHLYTSLADEHQAQLIPFFLAQLALQDGMMQADGIHPTEAAQPFMRDAVITGLKNLNLLPSNN